VCWPISDAVGQRHDPVQRELNLRVHRMLDPRRTVLVKRGYTILRRYIAWAGRVFAFTDEFKNGLLVLPLFQDGKGSVCALEPVLSSNIAQMKSTIITAIREAGSRTWLQEDLSRGSWRQFRNSALREGFFQTCIRDTYSPSCPMIFRATIMDFMFVARPLGSSAFQPTAPPGLPGKIAR
jgi:hypothetical protein